MIAYPSQEAVMYVTKEIVPLVNTFRQSQNPSGRVVGDHEVAKRLLVELRAQVRRIHALLAVPSAWTDAFEYDIDQWIERGLDTPPYFDSTLAAYAPPESNGPTFFIAPMTATNGPTPRGKFLECFLAYREEPEVLESIAAQMPHPKNGCQSTRLLTASSGLLDGNCIVFFPENVMTETKVESQSFALFFFNKFHRIYLNETMPRVRHLFGDRGWVSDQLSPADCYRARSIWGYLHDYFHHCGPRPLDSHLRVKMNFFVGLLEEIKVDCQSALAASTRDLPFSRELVEFIIFERLFRYTGQQDAPKNFDAGTGFLLFQWLLIHQYGLRETDSGLDINLDDCLVGMAELAQQIESIEDISDNDEYRQVAQQFVHSFLPQGEKGNRFSVPADFARLVRIHESSGPLLNFSDLPY